MEESGREGGTMTRYCIAWKLQKAQGGGVYTGPPLVHPEFIMEWSKDGKKKLLSCKKSLNTGTPLTKKEAEAKAQRMNLAEDFPSHHWAIKYKGREWNEINEKSTQTGQQVE